MRKHRTDRRKVGRTAVEWIWARGSPWDQPRECERDGCWGLWRASEMAGSWDRGTEGPLLVIPTALRRAGQTEERWTRRLGDKTDGRRAGEWAAGSGRLRGIERVSMKELWRDGRTDSGKD